MNEKEKRTLWIACGLIVLAALLPFVDQGYWLSIGVSIAMYTVLLLWPEACRLLM